MVHILDVVLECQINLSPPGRRANLTQRRIKTTFAWQNSRIVTAIVDWVQIELDPVGTARSILFVARTTLNFARVFVGQGTVGGWRGLILKLLSV